MRSAHSSMLVFARELVTRFTLDSSTGVQVEVVKFSMTATVLITAERQFGGRVGGHRQGVSRGRRLIRVGSAGARHEGGEWAEIT